MDDRYAIGNRTDDENVAPPVPRRRSWIAVLLVASLAICAAIFAIGSKPTPQNNKPTATAKLPTSAVEAAPAVSAPTLRIASSPVFRNGLVIFTMSYELNRANSELDTTTPISGFTADGCALKQQQLRGNKIEIKLKPLSSRLSFSVHAFKFSKNPNLSAVKSPTVTWSQGSAPDRGASATSSSTAASIKRRESPERGRRGSQGKTPVHNERRNRKPKIDAPPRLRDNPSYTDERRGRDYEKGGGL